MWNEKGKGLIIIISAPSGTGKTTLCQKLRDFFPQNIFPISFTTRPPRLGEREGIDYYFVSNNEFERKISQDKFVEWAKVHNYYYGTPFSFIEKGLAEGEDIILDIDVQGSMQIKEKYGKQTVLVFLLPPSKRELKIRLQKRKSENEYALQKRFLAAQEEIKYLKKYDYLIINDEITHAIKKIKAIIIAEKCKVKRQRSEQWLSP